MQIFGFSRFLLPLYDDGGADGGGVGAGAPAAAPGAPSGAPSGGQPVAGAAPAGSGQPAPGAPASAGQPNGQPAPRQFSYQEDRSNWVPSHVVRQHTERIRQMERDLYLAQQRVASLAGVQPPPAPANPEHEAIRQQFRQVFPELAALAEHADKLQKLTGVDFERLQQSSEQVWVTQGNNALNRLAERVKAAYGGADLQPKALQRIQRAFISELESDNEMRGRYESGDLTIVDDFVNDFTGGLLDPYRRTTAAPTPGQVAARRLPRGGGSSAVAGGAKPPTVKPSDGDAFHAAAFNRFQQG